MMSQTATVRIHFTHLRSELTDAELSRCGSPHVSKKEVGQRLLPQIVDRTRRPTCEFECSFQRSQIICANEVFPESVSADPLADLEIWDEWQQNIRRFPFPGLFSPLGIAGQSGKSTSPTSVGVLGEIMCGLFGQAYISPWVIVRPIRRWPDFIFFCSDERYAFVESKAFTGDPDGSERPLSRIPPATLHECLYDAVKQLNADPFVTVWFSFTEICRIDPMELRVTFLELNTTDQHRASKASQRFVPDAVIHGLAGRAASSAAARTIEDGSEFFDVMSGKKSRLKNFQDKVKASSKDEVSNVLEGAIPRSLFDAAAKDVSAEAQRLASKVNPQSTDPGKRMTAAKKRAVAGELGELRTIGNSRLYLVDLTSELRRLLDRDWHPNWEQAAQKWKTISRIDFWRCSSAAVGLGLEGQENESAVDR
jgi:hypothetical protein